MGKRQDTGEGPFTGICATLPLTVLSWGAGVARMEAEKSTSFLLSSPFPTCTTCRKPVRRIGKKIPVTLTWSPGWASLVFSPSTSTVMLRGMFPTGTWSLYRGESPRARRKVHEADEALIFWAYASHPASQPEEPKEGTPRSSLPNLPPALGHPSASASLFFLPSAL